MIAFARDDDGIPEPPAPVRECAHRPFTPPGQPRPTVDELREIMRRAPISSPRVDSSAWSKYARFAPMIIEPRAIIRRES